jgi:hypothetical protein
MYNPLGILAKHISFAGVGIDRMVFCILVCAGAPSIIAIVYFYVEMFAVVVVVVVW